MLIYAFGMTQAWHFSDIPPKPPLVDVIGMVGFWVPMMAMFLPVWWLANPVLITLAASLWSGVVAGAIVWTEERLLPASRGRFTTGVLTGTWASLVAFRSASELDRDGFVVLLLSSTILLVHVAMAYACIVYSAIRIVLGDGIASKTQARSAETAAEERGVAKD